ncbi:MAG: DUF58 domain-containing protein [Actinomycetota bacterium]|nr:DUF58 domain-containing protein [Actinomycetota bacterium]
MLTRHGVLATTVAVGLVVAGRLFGIFELFLLGAGGAALVVAAVAATGLTRLRLDVSRELRPDRLHAGAPGLVELRVTNGGSRRTPLLHLRDAVGDLGRVASVVLSPMAPGEQVAAVYSLPTDRRGHLAVGPLEVRVCDPFGLAALSTPAAPITTLTVWPAVEDVLAPPSVAGHHHDGGDPAGLAINGEELYGLRPYVDGDDLRRVHWRASAKRDELVVRQDERPGQGQVNVVLDVGTGAYVGDTFERAVSAAASLVVASTRRGLQARLVTTAGYDSGFGGAVGSMAVGRGPTPDHIDAILEHLAVVEERSLGHLATLVGAVDRPQGGPGGPVVVLTGSSPSRRPGVSPLGLAGAGSSRVVVVVLTTGGTSPVAASAGTRTVVVDDTTSFARAWNRAMTSTSKSKVAKAAKAAAGTSS